MHCIECPESEAISPEMDYGVADRSARAEYERRAAKRETAITERWGTGFAAKVVRALSTEPQSSRAWAIGAAGEEKLARELASVPGLQVLNDRRVRGTKGNLDHIVVAPAGVFVVDAKNHKGMVELRNRGWFLRPDYPSPSVAATALPWLTRWAGRSRPSRRHSRVRIRCRRYRRSCASLEDVLRDLRAWDAPEWRATVEQYRRWANELFDGLT